MISHQCQGSFSRWSVTQVLTWGVSLAAILSVCILARGRGTAAKGGTRGRNQDPACVHHTLHAHSDGAALGHRCVGGVRTPVQVLPVVSSDTGPGFIPPTGHCGRQGAGHRRPQFTRV